MNEITKALEALDRIFNYCEEIDLHIPKEEQIGYNMLVDINIIREALTNQKIGYWIDNAPEWQNIDPPYICSECGNFHLQKTNYCDQCGAKMEG